jgi:predicted acyl esterase
VRPDGLAVLVDRGTRVLLPAEAAAGRVSYQLQGNGWVFAPGHRIRIELAGDYEPYVHRTEVPFSLELSGVRLELPVRNSRR